MKTRPRTTARERGMTLLELLVAIGIFALAAGALFPVLSGAMSSRRDADAKLRVYGQARGIVDRIERDLVGGFDVGIPSQNLPRLRTPADERVRFGEARVLLEATANTARGVTAVDADLGGDDMPALAPDRGDQAHVLWRIDTDGRLLRQEVRPPRADEVDWSKVPVEVLATDADVRLEFYSPSQWSTSWDTSEAGPQRGVLPLLVRTSVTLRGPTDGAGEDVTLVSTVVLPAVADAYSPRGPMGRPPGR